MNASIAKKSRGAATGRACWRLGHWQPLGVAEVMPAEQAREAPSLTECMLRRNASTQPVQVYYRPQLLPRDSDDPVRTARIARISRRVYTVDDSHCWLAQAPSCVHFKRDELRGLNDRPLCLPLRINLPLRSSDVLAVALQGATALLKLACTSTGDA